MAFGSFTQEQVPVKPGEKCLTLIPNYEKRHTAGYLKMPLAEFQEELDEAKIEKLHYIPSHKDRFLLCSESP